MFVYIIKNQAGILYKGITKDIDRRIDIHNNGSNRWTTGKGPWKLVYCEEVSSRGEAMKREKFLKSGKGREFLKKILEDSKDF